MEDQFDKRTKRTKRADMTSGLEGSSLKTELLSEVVAMDDTLCVDSPTLTSMLNDVRIWLCRNMFFNNFLHPDNDQWRELILERLQIDFKKRHDLVVERVEDHTKNHLMWDLRRWAVKMVAINDRPDNAAWKELELTTTIINEDTNNLHAWSHRKWVLQTFVGDGKDKLWEDELVFCAQIIKEDPFNRYAWEQRYFVVTRCLLEIYGPSACEDSDFVQELDIYFHNKRSKEVDYAIKAIEDEPGNPCPWTHIMGLYTAHSGSMTLDVRVRGAILRVLEDERGRLNDLGTMDDGLVNFMNARGIINALNMLWDLLCHGYCCMIYEEELGKKIEDVLVALSPDCPSNSTSRSRIFSILEHVEKDLTACGLAWRNAGPQVFSGGPSIILEAFLKQKKGSEYQSLGQDEGMCDYQIY